MKDFRELKLCEGDIIAMFSSLIVLGTVGNVLSGLVMMQKAMRRSTIGLMLIILAVSDTLVLWTDLLRQYMLYVHGVELRTYSNIGCKMSRLAFKLQETSIPCYLI